MSGSVNKVILIGNLGNDPELRSSSNGLYVTTLNVATTEWRKDKDGKNFYSKTEWHRVVVFGNLAKNCAEYLRKGRKVYVEGSLCSRQITDSSGQERTIYEIRANNVIFLGRPEDKKVEEGEYTEEEPIAPVDEEDNIPF